MPGIDQSRPFHPLSMALLAVSDSRTLATDVSGDTLAERITAAGHRLAERRLLKDDMDAIRALALRWINDPAIDAILITGGTGLTGRDVTPEAITPLYDKEIPGFGELFRQLSYAKIGTSTIQSRATAGVAQGTYLFALPGSPSACRDGWDDILCSQLDNRYRPCNLAENIPRLLEHRAQ